MIRCGFAALMGRPNSGKSTLLNRLVGEKVSIVSDKPQTTRRRVLGVRTEGAVQIVFVDTPGIHRPGHQLNRLMMDDVYETLKEVDVVLHLVDASQKYGKGEEFVVDLMRQSEKPVLLLLTKADLVNKGRLLPMIEAFHERFSYQEVIPISALTGDNLDVLLKKIEGNLPEAEDFYYPPDYVADRRQRFVICEMIREKILNNTREEIPYATTVMVDQVDESRREEGFLHIAATIVVEKPNQKKIVIGRAGRMIKKIGTEARKDLQKALEVSKIYLELNVKVIPGWRDRLERVADAQF